MYFDMYRAQKGGLSRLIDNERKETICCIYLPNRLKAMVGRWLAWASTDWEAC